MTIRGFVRPYALRLPPNPIAHHCHPEAHHLIEMTISTVGMPSKKVLMGEGSRPEAGMP